MGLFGNKDKKSTSSSSKSSSSADGTRKKKEKRKTTAGNGVVSEKSKFAIVESYKAARTNIMFSLSAYDKKVFAVTSYSKGEGKSTVSANLAISFAKMGKKVLLIDADLRRPNAHNIFRVSNKQGLSNVIGKMVTFDDAVHREVLKNLDVVTSGTVPPNPSELMCSNSFVNPMGRLSQEYDYIIIDTPPIGVVADALLLKDLIAGFVLVVRERATTHGDLKKLLASVKMADTKALGIVEVGCAVSGKKSKKGYYYYQYY